MRYTSPSPQSRRASRAPWRPKLSLLAFVALAVLLAFGTLMRVYALPAEARLSETWYAYQQQMKYDFAANVQTGNIYPNRVMPSQDLLQVKLPVEPPIYRRALVSKLTDTITLQFPYTFHADRTGTIHVKYWADGVLTVPSLWQRPLPPLPAQEIAVVGDQVTLDKFSVEIPVKQIVTELDKLTQDMKVVQDQAEIRVRPHVSITVDGQKQPVAADLNPEVVVAIRSTGTAVEVDEPKVFSGEQQFTETKLLPATVDVFGYKIGLAAARQIAVVALSAFALILAVLLIVQWWRAGKKGEEDLVKLGPALLVVRGLDIPEDATMVDVATPQQLVQLHLQTDRPVIQVGASYYLLDGNTCYRLDLTDRSAGTA